MTQPARTDQNAPGRPGTTLVTGLMLFALFFGAGNLIFPPVLGASAGDRLPAVMAGFLITGVLLPLVAVIAVSTSGEGILGLARRVDGSARSRPRPCTCPSGRSTRYRGW